MSQIAASGGQPQKQPKYAPIYTGRFFNGINTNRSPLRAASADHRMEKYYGDASSDALIAGSNLEVSNRLTLVRRPGNPIYDNVHTYNHPDVFSDFRVNKAASDKLGTTLEKLYAMIDETTTSSYNGLLYSLTDDFKRGGDASYFTGLNFQKSSGSGQAYMQEVGNSLYFTDGVENKKWLQSLIDRTSAADNMFLQGVDGLAGTYPFGSYLLDPATGNPQEFIGITIGRVTNVVVANKVLTLSVTMTSDVNDYPTGTSFQLYGMQTTANQWTNGLTITLTQDYTHSSSTTFVATTNHADYSSAESSNPNYIIQAGTTPVIAQLGSSVPTYGTVVPDNTTNALYGGQFIGSLTLDGNTVWINRGTPSTGGSTGVPSVMNWGIKPPAGTPGPSVSGAEQSWQKNTYYSPASVFIDPTHGNLWQVTTAGTTGAAQPTWGTPTISQKVDITNVSITGGIVTFTTSTQSPAFIAGDVIDASNLGPASFLNGESFTVRSAGLTTTQFTATTSHGPYTSAADAGTGTLAGSTVTDGTVVWTAIQSKASLDWASDHHYRLGDFIVATTPAGKALFQVTAASNFPFINGKVGGGTGIAFGWQLQDSAWSTGPVGYQGSVGLWNSADPNNPGGSDQFSSWANTQTIGSLAWNGVGPGDEMIWYAVDGAGNLGAQTPMGPTGNPGHWMGAAVLEVYIPAAGAYNFTLHADDAAFFSFDTSSGAYNSTPGSYTAAFFSPGSSTPLGDPGIDRQITVEKGYGSLTGVTSLTGNDNQGDHTETSTWVFRAPGNYALEVDYAQYIHAQFMTLELNGTQIIPTAPVASGSHQPAWPSFTLTGLSFDGTKLVWGSGDIVNDGAFTWSNLGPISTTNGPDYIWRAKTPYTLPNTGIIDTNGNIEGPAETGISDTTPPTFSATMNAITKDTGFPTLQWINEGSGQTTASTGVIRATSTQGFLYWIALVNTLDNTVSNLGPVSPGTGPFLGGGQVVFAPGAGLGLGSTAQINAIDPQADYVAIFRSTDGFTTPLLIPGFVNSPYTVPLTQYLRNGYVDTVPDSQLNNLVQGAQALENTPPEIGAINLTYHLNRIWYSVGNTVRWTTGPLAPVGNGTDGAAPGNFAVCPSQVKRLVPVAIGMLVFTISDIYIIPGNGTLTSPILPAIPYLTGVGLGNHNGLDINGGLIGFFTTDKQFVIFDPSAGLHYVGYNIGDQFRLNNGLAGTSWNPTTVYVTWYINGEDQGWYTGDAVNGWYRLIATPAPEQGSVAWSPFATIQGSAGAMASVEISPGVHRLMIGQTSGPITNPAAAQFGTSSNYALLAAAGITNTGSTVITGGVIGSYPTTTITGFNPPPATVDNTNAHTAQTDALAAYNHYAGLTFTSLSGSSANLSVLGNGVNAATYLPGNYSAGTSMDIPTSITLDAQGNPNAVFVFKAGSTLTLESGQSVILANGAQASNVFWVVGSSFTMVATSHMVGTIMADTSATLGGGSLLGRVLAGIVTSSGAITIAAAMTITAGGPASIPATIATGRILNRDLTATTDNGSTGANGTAYPAWGVIGSIVLAQPGQIAKVAFITTTSVKTGSPLVLGVILNEALPYFTGSFDILKHWVSDPPGIPESRSFYRQRFYLAEDELSTAYCSDLQILVQFPAEAALNELQTLTVFGAYEVEQ